VAAGSAHRVITISCHANNFGSTAVITIVNNKPQRPINVTPSVNNHAWGITIARQLLPRRHRYRQGQYQQIARHHHPSSPSHQQSMAHNQRQ